MIWACLPDNNNSIYTSHEAVRPLAFPSSWLSLSCMVEPHAVSLSFLMASVEACNVVWGLDLFCDVLISAGRESVRSSHQY